MANTENLKIIRFLGGEEIIAEVTSDSGNVMTVKNAVRIMVIPSKTDPANPSVGLAPFMQFSEDKEMTLNKNVIVTVVSPIKEFINQYNTVFGGLVVPDSKIIKP